MNYDLRDSDLATVLNTKSEAACALSGQNLGGRPYCLPGTPVSELVRVRADVFVCRRVYAPGGMPMRRRNALAKASSDA